MSSFSKCSTCKRLWTAFQTATNNVQSTTAVKAPKDAHIPSIVRQWRGYRERTEMANSESLDYLSLAIDRADQSKYFLSHFITQRNDQRGHRMPLHVFGVLLHSPVPVLRLFTMTDDNKTGANHIIEVLRRVLWHGNKRFCSSQVLSTTG